MRKMGESAGGQERVTWSMFYLRPMRQMGESAGGQVRVTWSMFYLPETNETDG
jgi:hypothetical protein